MRKAYPQIAHGTKGRGKSKKVGGRGHGRRVRRKKDFQQVIGLQDHPSHEAKEPQGDVKRRQDFQEFKNSGLRALGSVPHLLRAFL